MTDKANPTWPAVGAVRDWLAAAGLRVHEHPTLDVPSKEREMACALIEEEAAEFRAAVEASDLVEIADAIADLIWVVLEAGITFGIPIEDVFAAEVRRSNLTKIETGEPVVNANGKIVAGRSEEVTRAPSALPAELSQFAVGGVDDILVFRHADVGFSLIGGTGLGAGWAGIVDLDLADDSLVRRAWRGDMACRQAGGPGAAGRGALPLTPAPTG